MKVVVFGILAVTLSLIIAFGSLAHALLPHTHSANEAITSLLHSALRHEDKKLSDMVPPAPLFAAVLVAAIVLSTLIHIAPIYARTFLVPGFEFMRRGIALYRRFG